VNTKIIDFIKELLIEKDYKIDKYSDDSFRAHHNKNYFQEIHCFVSDEDILIIHPDICVHTRNRTLQETIKELITLYNAAEKDIEHVKEKISDITQKDSMIKILELCEVPQTIIEYIKNKG